MLANRYDVEVFTACHQRPDVDNPWNRAGSVCECFAIRNGNVTQVEIHELATGPFEIDVCSIATNDASLFEVLNPVSDCRPRDVNRLSDRGCGRIASVFHEGIEDAAINIIKSIIGFRIWHGCG